MRIEKAYELYLLPTTILSLCVWRDTGPGNLIRSPTEIVVQLRTVVSIS